jgi:hypothetical protein
MLAAQHKMLSLVENSCTFICLLSVLSTTILSNASVKIPDPGTISADQS